MIKIKYTSDFLEKVTSFGILGYSAEKIIDLTQPDDPEQFRVDFNTPGTDIYKSFRKGKTTGEYALDKEMFEKATKNHDSAANEALNNRMIAKRINDGIFERFDI